MAPGDEEPSVGEVVEQLVDDGKAYARAELALVQARVGAKVEGYRTPAILLGSAAALGLVALVCFGVTLVLALASLIGPLGGGLAATVLVAALAGLLGWLAVGRIRKA